MKVLQVFCMCFFVATTECFAGNTKLLAFGRPAWPG